MGRDANQVADLPNAAANHDGCLMDAVRLECIRPDIGSNHAESIQCYQGVNNFLAKTPDKVLDATFRAIIRKRQNNDAI